MKIWNRATRILKINKNKSSIIVTRKANEEVQLVVKGELFGSLYKQ